MRRWLVRFFLLISFFLLKGYSQLYAHAHEFRSGMGREKIPKIASSHGSVSKHDSRDLIHKASSENKREKQKNKATEVDEEEEVLRSGRSLEIGTACISFFSTETPDYYHRYLKNRLPVCEHFSCTTSYKFILYRVIRI